MIVVRHRINSIEELIVIPETQGIEIDLRSLNGALILQHDPFRKGELFSEWIKYFRHALLILNTKEEGLEQAIIKILQKNNVASYFFLDQSFPKQFKMSITEPDVVCGRLSDIESIQTILALKPGWLWLDSHTGNWDYILNSYAYIKSIKIKTCLVSPELQRNNPIKEIKLLKNMIYRHNLIFDAVCTKDPEQWA